MTERRAGNGSNGVAPLRPELLVAELTHRCSLGCPYCCNPLALEPREVELDVATWTRVFAEAAALGVRQVHLSGGEPGARHDLVDIAANAREAGLRTSLITSGVGITTRTMRDLWEAGLDRVQVSFQDADAVSADRIAGQRGAFQRKHALAAEAVRLGLPLTVHVVVHRANMARVRGMVDLALALKASRVEIAHVQYAGWALKSRAALMPTRAQIERAAGELGELRRLYGGRIAIEEFLAVDRADPDMHRICWDPRSFGIAPSGLVLPCPMAQAVPDLEFWNVRDRGLAEIWTLSPAFEVFRQAEGPPLVPRCRSAVDEPDVGQMQPAYTYRHL